MFKRLLCGLALLVAPWVAGAQPVGGPETLGFDGTAQPFVHVSLSVAQTTNLAAGDHIKFDNVVAQSASQDFIECDTATGYVTTDNVPSVGRCEIKEPGTYSFSQFTLATFTSDTLGVLNTVIYDTTNDRELGAGSWEEANNKSTVLSVSGGVDVGVFTFGALEVPAWVEVRFTAFNTNVVNILGGGSSFTITMMGTSGSALAIDSDADGYGEVESDPTTEKEVYIDVDSDGNWECKAGLVGSNGGGITCNPSNAGGSSIVGYEDTDEAGDNSITLNWPASISSNLDLTMEDDSTPMDTLVTHMGATMVFCGQGAAAGATVYLAPPTALGEELVPGNAACNAKDAAAVATADDLPFGAQSGYTVRGMVCQLNSGTDDTVDISFVDDTVVSSTVTCTITAAGGIDTCRVQADQVVAAGSLVALEADADDDDLSAQDYLCHVFVSF